MVSIWIYEPWGWQKTLNVKSALNERVNRISHPDVIGVAPVKTLLDTFSYLPADLYRTQYFSLVPIWCNRLGCAIRDATSYLIYNSGYWCWGLDAECLEFNFVWVINRCPLFSQQKSGWKKYPAAECPQLDTKWRERFVSRCERRSDLWSDQPTIRGVMGKL